MRFVGFFVALAVCFGLFPNINPLYAQNHLVLARHFRESPPGESRPVLVRELLRQALLIAAREEMGVRTSDEVLGMAVTKKGDGKLLVRPNLQVKADATTAEFGVYSSGSDDPIWKKGTTATYIDSDIGVISRDMQKLSRTEFPALLSKLGLKASEKRPVASKAKDAAVPSDVLKSIRSLHNDFDAFSQCMAIQKIHAVLEKQGDDAELLALLAKSYANLFQLVQPVTDGLPQVFAARALLYSDRLVELFPNDVSARWARGYAHALVGSLLTAEKDLTMEIEKQPLWAEVARHITFFETDKLDGLLAKSKSPDDKIISFARVLTFEGSPIPKIRLTALEIAEKRMPGNPRLTFAMFMEMGVGAGTSLIHRAIESWNQTVSNLRSSSTFPPSISEAKTYRQFIERIESSSAEAWSELPNVAIARIIDDITFWLVAARIRHYDYAISIDTSDLINDCRADLKGHRHWPYIDLLKDSKMTLDDQLAIDFRKRLAKVRIVDATYFDFATQLTPDTWYDRTPSRALQPVKVPHAFTRQSTLERSSVTAWEMLRYAGRSPSGFNGQPGGLPVSDGLRETAPHSPCANAFWLSDRWAKEGERFDELRSKFKDQTCFDIVMSIKTRTEKNSNRATDALERVLKVSSDASTFNYLATIYKERGNLKKWAETQERSLDFDSPDLSQSTVMAELAGYYLKTEDDPLTALRFAQGAASSGSAAGLWSLSDVHTALQEWKEAEELIRAVGERYDRPYEWLMWCLTNNQGDLEGAKNAAAKYEEVLIGSKSSTDQFTRYVIRKMMGLAIDEELQGQVLANTTHAGFFLYAILDCWERNDLEARDKTIESQAIALERFKKSTTSIAALDVLSDIIVESISKKRSPEESEALINAAIQKFPEATTIGYFAGRFFELSNDKARALKMYEYGTKPATGGFARTPTILSLMKVRELKR